MIYVTFERKVRRPPAVVWAFLTDVAALTTWVDELVEVRVMGDEPLRTGTSLQLERRSSGKIEHVTSEITAFREPTLLAAETRVNKLLFLDRITLTPIPEGTQLGVYAERMYGPRSASIFARQPGLTVPTPQELSIRGAYERSVDALVTRIERQSAIPYR
ncbi:hypothetical protein BH11MYX4_BH11MYX4_42110 [soil metagenome]